MASPTSRRIKPEFNSRWFEIQAESDSPIEPDHSAKISGLVSTQIS